MLIALLTLGLGTAAIERWRPEDFDPVWGRVHERITRVLNPISDRTYRIFSVAFKVDRMFKVEEENNRLLRENSELNIKNQLLSEELSRLNRLAGLGRWSGPSELVFISANVSGLITSGPSVSLMINRGRRDGVRPRDPVVALGGLVGLVQWASNTTARVQTVTDPLSAVGVMDRTSRARGILYGGDNKKEPLKFMPENEVQPINIGGELITSGFENSVYPKGIIVGTIQERKPDTWYGMPYGIVKPAVSIETLEEVLLVIPRDRLSGMTDATTASLGAKRIFMPASPMSADLDDTVTTRTLAPPRADGATTATLAEDNPATATLSTPSVPLNTPASPPDEAIQPPTPIQGTSAEPTTDRGGHTPKPTPPPDRPKRVKGGARKTEKRSAPGGEESSRNSGGRSNDIGPGDFSR